MKPTYAEVAQRCLDRLGQYNLDMESYSNEEHSCGTSFCMLGDLISQDRGEVKGIMQYTESVLGLQLFTLEWDWLFSGEWSNDIELAKKRCEYAIKYNRPPDSFTLHGPGVSYEEKLKEGSI